MTVGTIIWLAKYSLSALPSVGRANVPLSTKKSNYEFN